MTQSTEPLKDVTVGAAIYTADDDHLGKVKDVQGGFFEVDARLQEDYWLKRDYIASATGERVTLMFNKDELDRYKGQTWDVGNFPETEVGAEVYTNDNDLVGKVKEVNGGFFKVDVPRHRDHWFQRQFIASSSSEKVTMQFNKDDIDHYSIKFPGDELPPGVHPEDRDSPSRAENPAAATLRAVEHHPEQQRPSV